MRIEKLRVVCPTAFDDEIGEVLFEISDESGNTKEVSVGTIFWDRHGYSVNVDVFLGIPCDEDLANRIKTLVKRAYERKYRVERIVVYGSGGDRFEYPS